ncbi:MAG: hypothetical protein RIT45_4178 [Pseudomonadota bacterium]
MRIPGFEGPKRRLSVWIAVACSLGAPACNETSAPTEKPGPAVELPPAVPFEAEGGTKARGWSVPPESAGEVLSRLQRGEKLEAVLKDLEARKPGILTASKGATPMPPPPPSAAGIGGMDPAAAGQLVPGAEKPAVARVMRRFALIEGQPIRVKEVEARSGMWRIRFSGVPDGAGKPAAEDREVWVTADAKLMFAGGTVLDREIEQLEADRAFGRCLRDVGVRAYLDPRAPAGAEQLLALGKYAGMISIDCGAQTAACHAAGVRKLPTVAVRDKLHEGLQNRAALTALTGCR